MMVQELSALGGGLRSPSALVSLFFVQYILTKETYSTILSFVNYIIGLNCCSAKEQEYQ